MQKGVNALTNLGKSSFNLSLLSGRCHGTPSGENNERLVILVRWREGKLIFPVHRCVHWIALNFPPFRFIISPQILINSKSCSSPRTASPRDIDVPWNAKWRQFVILLPVLSSIALRRPELRIDDFQTPVEVISMAVIAISTWEKSLFSTAASVNSSGFVKLSIRLIWFFMKSRCLLSVNMFPCHSFLFGSRLLSLCLLCADPN